MSFKCPKCGNDGNEAVIRICVKASLYAVPNDTPELNGEQAWITDTEVDEWGPDSPCVCAKCDYDGIYSEFAIEEA